MQLKGKVAIVTGAAGGLGRALVEALLEQGAKVYVFDVEAERGHDVERSLQTKFDAFQRVVEKHGKVDVMVNNAAIVEERNNIDKMLLVNLEGTIRGSNLAIKHMRKDEGGQGGVIINVNSVAGARPLVALPAYVSTKHGICGFTRSWAENSYLKDMGLRFGQLCPYLFESFIVQDADRQILFPKVYDMIVEEAGFQRTEDIAAGLIELLEDDDSNGVMLFSHPKERTHRKRITVINET